MRQAFQISASATPWTNQPITEKVIAVSTSASDGSKNLVLQGTVSGSPDGETVTFGSEGRIEKESTKTYEALIAASLSASAAGTVRIYGQGSTASGTVIVSTNPAPGDTWTIGLVGNTRNYKFVSKGQTTIECLDAASITSGFYFDLVLSGGSTKRFWYNKSGAGGAPADPGGGLTAIAITIGNTAAQVATATEAVLEAVTDLTCTVDTATVTVNYDIWGTMAFTDGTTTFTFTAVSPGYADAANNVTIGATASDTATNLNKAINDTGTEGTHYGTGTTINEYLSSTVSGSIVTITDKIACDRYLGWTTTQSGSGLSLAGPTGGVNGTILGTIGVGTTGIQDAFTLDNEDLDAVSANFPGTITPTFDALFVGGAPFRVYAARGTGSNVVFKIMGGHSSTTCTEEILTGLTAGSATYEVKPAVATAAPSGFEYIQPICTSNGNSAPIQLAAYVVSG
jgi:hypothetical protein